jgi:hypothetical protein
MYREKSSLGTKIKDLVDKLDGSTRSGGLARTFIGGLGAVVWNDVSALGAANVPVENGNRLA